MKRQVIAPDASYTFSDYFKLEATTEEVLEYFGFSFSVNRLALLSNSVEEERLADLSARLEEIFSFVGLTNEMARREFLIAPVIAEVAHYTHAKVRVEYAVDAGPQLHGTLDYFLHSQHNLLVVEAKNADLTRGFTQMAVELVALDKLLEDESEMLYGAVSIGESWRFGRLDRKTRHVAQELNSYRVPADLGDVLGILLGILA